MKPTIPQKGRRSPPLALAFELALLAAITLMVVSGARPAAAQELPDTNAPNTTVKNYPLAHPFVPCESGEYCHVPYGVHTFDASAVSPTGLGSETAIAEYENRETNRD